MNRATIKANDRHVDYHMFDVWIDDEELREEVRSFFSDYLQGVDMNPYVGEMEITVDGFYETLENEVLVDLSEYARGLIAIILNKIEDGDYAGILFVKKREDVTP